MSAVPALARTGFGDDDTIRLPDGRVMIDCTPYKWIPPADQYLHPYRDHQGDEAQYLRDFILGINDGLISTLLLVIGLVGGGGASKDILLAALTGAVAGAIAMGLGELIATQSQNEVVEGEKKVELEHFKYHRMTEVNQARDFFRSLGLSGPLLEAVIKRIASSDEHLMSVMERFEFGTSFDGEDESSGRNPLKSMLMSGRLFFIGAMPSTLPFIYPDPTVAAVIACFLSGVTLFGVGVYQTKTTGGDPCIAGKKNFMAGVIGASISFAIGFAYGRRGAA